MLHRIGVLPVRFTFDRPELQVRAVRVIGYRMVCSCGERSKVRPTYALARVDAQAHRVMSEEGEGVSPLDT